MLRAAAHPASKVLDDFIKELNSFLIPHGIHFSYCTIFTDTLLRAADITTQSDRCTFYQDSISLTTARFEISPITREDATKFKQHYQHLCEADGHFKVIFDDKAATAHIMIDAHMLKNHLLPVFKEQFKHIQLFRLDCFKKLSKANIAVKDYAALHDILAQVNRFITNYGNDFGMGVLTVLFDQLNEAVEEHTRYHLDDSSAEKDRADAKLRNELTNFINRATRLLDASQALDNIIAAMQQYKWSYCPTDTHSLRESIAVDEAAHLALARTACGLSRSGSFVLFQPAVPSLARSLSPESRDLALVLGIYGPFDVHDGDDDSDVTLKTGVGFPKR